MSSPRSFSAFVAASLAVAATAQFPCLVQDGNAAYTFTGPGPNCTTPGGQSHFTTNAIDLEAFFSYVVAVAPLDLPGVALGRFLDL